MHSCDDCRKIFKYENDRNQHQGHLHRQTIHYVLINTNNACFRCFILGPERGCYDGKQGFECQYLDRKTYSILDLLENGVRPWAFERVTGKDETAKQAFYEQSGTIVEKDDKAISEY